MKIIFKPTFRLILLFFWFSSPLFTQAQAPAFTTTPTLSVAYNNAYNYSVVATTEGSLLTTLTAPTLPAWLSFTGQGQGQGQATLFGNIPSGISISGVAGDDNGNIYAITTDGTSIYKIASDGTTTLWRNGLISGNVYALHIANGYNYIYFKSIQLVIQAFLLSWA